MSFLAATQNERRALVRALMIVSGLALLALASAGRLTEFSVHEPILALLVVFCALAILEFVTFDEVAKRAHYTAWYWGSFIGVATIALVQVFAAIGGDVTALVRWLGDADPATSFMAGLMVSPVLMAIGFFVVRGIDWLRIR